MTDWQPIETAPKDGSKIILYRDSDVFALCSWGGEEISENGAFWIWWVPEPEWIAEIKNPTHWIPLPAPPKGNEQ